MKTTDQNEAQGISQGRRDFLTTSMLMAAMTLVSGNAAAADKNAQAV